MSDFGIGLSVVVLLWMLVYVVDNTLRRSRFHDLYIYWLNSRGITISVAQVRFFTAALNRTFVRLARWRQGVLRIWFNLGVIFGLFAMVASTMLLIYMIFSALRPLSGDPTGGQSLVLVLPGVNLPYTQLAYIFVALLLSAVVHEAGHAVAAIREDVKLNGFGLFLMAIYPGAFVDLETEGLMSRSPKSQLRIYCAGVWHNFVMLIVSYLILQSVPLALSSMYRTGHGVVVVHIDPESPLYSPSTFPPGTVITELNRCPVTDTASWGNCISNVVSQPSEGFCMDYNKIDHVLSEHELKNFTVSPATMISSVECCESMSARDLCFMYKRPRTGVRYRCLQARPVLANLECEDNRDCYLFYGESSTCLFPSQPSSSRLLRVTHSGAVNDLLYIGDVYKFSYAITVSDFVPIYPLQVPGKLPDVLVTLLKYIVSFSAALALLNVVPCYTLDGQWVLGAVLDWVSARFPAVLDPSDKESLRVVLLSLGSILLLVNIAIAVIHAIV